MACIKPFRALRYDLETAGPIGELACPPYDIVGEIQYRELLEKNPRNMIRLELPRGKEPYKEAKELLNTWLNQGILKRDMDPGLYIYEETFLDRVNNGAEKKLRSLICRVRLEDFSAGVVLPHEETLSRAKEDRFRLMEATHCNFSQIYCLYRDEAGKTRRRIDNLAATVPPRYEFTDGLVTHRLWVVNDPVAISALQEDFAPRKLYIADGHHRYETALRYRDHLEETNGYMPGADYVMMALADMEDPALTVLPTHRMLRDLPGFSSEELLSQCEPLFDRASVGSQAEAQEALDTAFEKGLHAFVFYDGAWRVLTLREPEVMDRILPDRSPTYRRLDVTILHSLILEKILHIDRENMAAQKNLFYTRSPEEAAASVDRGESLCCFLLNPTRVEEIGGVAAAGEKMPQKSTYFYPKLITGLVINDLSQE